MMAAKFTVSFRDLDTATLVRKAIAEKRDRLHAESIVLRNEIKELQEDGEVEKDEIHDMDDRFKAMQQAVGKLSDALLEF